MRDRGAALLGRIEPDDKSITLVAAADGGAALHEAVERQDLRINFAGRRQDEIGLVVQVLHIAVDADVIAARRDIAIKGAAGHRNPGYGTVEAEEAEKGAVQS